MLFLIFACFNNFGVSEILPSLSSCKFILSDNIDVAKKSLFSSKGFKESIEFEIFSILSESINLQFDSEGRILLTSKLLKHAKIRNTMIFVGQGKTFQIWEPIIFEKFKAGARKKANLNRASLKWDN